jgi:hypothetical protein
VDSAQLLRDRLAAEVPELRVIDTAEIAERPGVAGVDPGSTPSVAEKNASLGYL